VITLKNLIRRVECTKNIVPKVPTALITLIGDLTPQVSPDRNSPEGAPFSRV
jgi:hypothetical protein